MPDPISALPAGDLPADPKRIFVYAGFWWRVAAYLIDAIILLPVGIVTYILTSHGTVSFDTLDDESTRAVSLFVPKAFAAFPGIHVGIRGLFIHALSWSITLLYGTLFQCSRLQATPGKLACRLRVTDLGARRISFWRSLGRQCARIVSGFTIIGVLMIAWTRRKQGLHDLAAGTLVLRASYADPVVFVPPSVA
jgi:hypothetical protein